MSPVFRTTSGLRSWGRVTRGLHAVTRPGWRDELAAAVGAAGAHAGGGLAIGLSRSYGDSGLNPGGAVIAMAGLGRIHSFDARAGLIRADAGLSLDGLIRAVVPRGWFPPVVPGTKYVTLGGAVANDIHGKNHHRAGTFGRHVTKLGLLRTDGSFHEIRPGDQLFAATVGGLGLTGVIAWVELQLAPMASARLEAETIAFGSLADFFRLATESEPTHAYTVAWIDCTQSGANLGRGIFSRANPSAVPDRTLHPVAPRRRFPVEAPSFALNPLTLKAFNLAYYAAGKLKAGRASVHYDPFFFPLDAVADWNRLYGAAGMYQYQCVIPPDAAPDAVRELLVQIARSGEGSFLAVLKTFGALASPGLLSFPMEGATLALDFRNRGDVTLALFDRLDSVVREARGRLYPAKDGRIGRAMFIDGYPGLAAFQASLDPGLSSGFWRRVQP